MKRIVMMLLGGCLVCTAANAAVQGDPTRPKYTQEHLDNLFQQAVMLEQAGMHDEAKRVCAVILSQTPEQPVVKKLLADIEAKQRAVARPDPSAALRRELEQIILPEVNFREANVTDVIAFLREESKKYTKDKTELNFVLLLPDGKTPTVTLSLRKIPMLGVIRYITVLTGLQYQIDDQAVVISPPPKLAPAK
jgi:hypothetical protein